MKRKRIFRYRLSPETFGYTLVPHFPRYIFMAWYLVKYRETLLLPPTYGLVSKRILICEVS